MFSPIPYYKDGKIQKICIDSSGYIITRYKNEHEKYSSKLSLSDDNKLLLEQEYYDTIREFLEINKLKYELLKRKIGNKINMKINNGLMLASVLSLFFSLVLIFSGSIYINLVGIILISISFLTFSYSYKNMKTNKAATNPRTTKKKYFPSLPSQIVPTLHHPKINARKGPVTARVSLFIILPAPVFTEFFTAAWRAHCSITAITTLTP